MNARTAKIMARYGIKPQQSRPTRSRLVKALYKAQATLIGVVATAAFAVVAYR